MTRPKKERCIACAPDATFFKPRGIPMADLEEVFLEADEIEAMRLADLENMYHEEAARLMKISRSTFGRILASAHRKVADALLHGKALKLNFEEKPQ